MTTPTKALIALGCCFGIIFGVICICMFVYWCIKIAYLAITVHPIALVVGTIGIFMTACTILAGQKE